MSARPAPLPAVLAVTFLGSVSGGAFWAGQATAGAADAAPTTVAITLAAAALTAYPGVRPYLRALRMRA